MKQQITFYLNKEYFNFNDLRGFTELFLLVPFLSEEIYFNKLIPIIGNHNEANFTKLFFSGKNLIEEETLEKCDYSIVPFKYNPNDSRIIEICNKAKFYNKKVISFFCDDSKEIFSLPDNLILFRSSVFKSQKQNNERIFPTLIPDHFCKNFDKNIKNSIGFCGHIDTEIRKRVYDKIKNTKIELDFIIRSGFWSPESFSKIKARSDYNKNMLNNKYILCMSGAGNFSYRFYEALSFGRIPILINTDLELPFKKQIKWDEFIILINEKEIDNLAFILKNDKRDMLKNRLMWEEYFSIDGYTKNFTKDI